MNSYMADGTWRELERGAVRGRPALVLRRRPGHLLDLLDASAGPPDLDFLVHGERRIRFGDFRIAVERAVRELAALGVRPGQRVLVVLFNSPELLLLQWAAWRVGAVAVLGNRWWTPTDLDAAAARVDATVIVTDVAASSRADPFITRITPDVVSGWWQTGGPGEAPADPRTSSREDDIALIEFTAGSSGVPKAVVLSHRNLIWTPQTIHVMRGGRPAAPTTASDQKVSLFTTPMFHNGAVVAGLSALLDGNRIVIPQGKFDPAQVIRLIESERVTSWSAVPTMFQRVLRHPDLGRHDLSSLVAPATGGAIVRLELLAELESRLPGCIASFTSGYGMTEMSFLTMVTAPQMKARAATVGKLVPGVELRVDAADERGEGELIARSAALMIGYLDGENQPIDDQGWYRTGDLGRVDSEGFVYITGRAKDMVIRGGENVSCPRVEGAIAGHSRVAEVAVIGYRHAELGEAVAAVVHLRAPAHGDPVDAEAELRAFVSGKLAYFEVPSRWLFRDAPLPVLPTGKIDKRSLQRELAAALAAGEH
jgi:acyl-CoA synthetase (AMP-forming)/AMP-acid ligase II